MGARFEELAWRETPIGEISLRRRRDPALGSEVYEVKLDDEYLMSSAFPVAEIELARLGLAPLTGTELDVVVGGLGLGYTARTALEDPRVRSLLVVEAIEDVIDWHRRDLLPFAAGLAADPRTRFVRADFFAAVADGGFDPDEPGRRFHAVLLDVDHSPRQVLHPSHAAFYTVDGLRRLAALLHPQGVFALWSNDPPDQAFQRTLTEVFPTSVAHVVRFPNPLQGREAANTVYVARH
ncbi:MULTISPECIES: spermidine synthase [unclassified Micromonospora]|uniref:spermidine synthase n=1 Tax=unclassified Micromonospora TaxID=2617518 RepID=UPI001B399790|nr:MULTISPECIES: spermidine synthase [unclassified Micromonospora]MBQ1041198.1 spermidine synthase [Micromonospora sp. C72]MBQ1055002.1 spermidine synthase [Micromonospora sp. C32]